MSEVINGSERRFYVVNGTAKPAGPMTLTEACNLACDVTKLRFCSESLVRGRSSSGVSGLQRANVYRYNAVFIGTAMDLRLLQISDKPAQMEAEAARLVTEERAKVLAEANKKTDEAIRRMVGYLPPLELTVNWKDGQVTHIPVMRRLGVSADAGLVKSITFGV